MSKYSGGGFIKFADVKKPTTKVIVSQEEGKYEKPVLTFSDGTKFSLNATNNKAMCRLFGDDDAGWIGQRIQLYRGVIAYNGADDNPALLVQAAPRDNAVNGDDDGMDDAAF
jgi:hypothetical protein